MEITIQLPDRLGQALQPFRDRLPEVIERGLQELLAESRVQSNDENQIMELLVSQPTPEQVLALHPRISSSDQRVATTQQAERSIGN
jgi:hypothetical protein